MKAKMRFGRLTTVRRAGRRDGLGSKVYWHCKCDCGNKVVAKGAFLVNGHTRSCGCLQRELAKTRATTHGRSYSREYLAEKARERMALKRIHDVDWTPEMAKALHLLQPMCVLCDATDRLVVDHVQPLSKGNGLRPGNAVILCRSCNSMKHCKDLNELPPAIAEKISRAAKAFEKEWFRGLRDSGGTAKVQTSTVSIRASKPRRKAKSSRASVKRSA